MRWAPALLWMLVLFFSSGTPGSQVPHFGSLDYFVKKGGHILGYAVLGLLYRRALGPNGGAGLRSSGTAWLLAVAYAMADEFHQSFVPGRHPALLDVLWFDGGGAALGLWLRAAFQRRKLRTPGG
jgi:VanZ family protein